jgi:pyrimidine-nucleoside phosphorylase
MMGQTDDLAPADRLLYALRDVTATTDCVPLIVSSILSKKLAENLDGLVLDVKFGAGAFMRDAPQGRALAEALISTARAEGVRATAFLTPMDEPLGWKVGNQLEVEECADFLVGIDEEPGLRDLTFHLAAEMVSLASRGKVAFEQALEECPREVRSGNPRRAFEAMFRRQGGDWGAFEGRRRALEDRPRRAVKAAQSGVVRRMDALAIAKLVRSLGGGRQSKESTINLDVGVVVRKKIGDRVEAGETLFEVVFSEPPSSDWEIRAEQFVSVEAGAVPATRWIEEVLRA